MALMRVFPMAVTTTALTGAVLHPVPWYGRLDDLGEALVCRSRTGSYHFLVSIYGNGKEEEPMKPLTFGAFVVAAACLFPGDVLAQSGSGSPGSGSAGSDVRSGMTSQGLASEPAGIGERGTGQTQSTLERSGGAASKGMTSEPPGIGERGTGQTQSGMERSGLEPSPNQASQSSDGSTGTSSPAQS